MLISSHHHHSCELATVVVITLSTCMACMHSYISTDSTCSCLTTSMYTCMFYNLGTHTQCCHSVMYTCIHLLQLMGIVGLWDYLLLRMAGEVLGGMRGVAWAGEGGMGVWSLDMATWRNKLGLGRGVGS